MQGHLDEGESCQDGQPCRSARKRRFPGSGAPGERRNETQGPGREMAEPEPGFPEGETQIPETRRRRCAVPGGGHEGMGGNSGLPESLPTESEQLLPISGGQPAELGLPRYQAPVDPISPSGTGLPKRGAIQPFLHEMAISVEENLGTVRFLFLEPGEEFGLGDHGSLAVVDRHHHQGDTAGPQGSQALQMAFNQGEIPGPDVMYG